MTGAYRSILFSSFTNVGVWKRLTEIHILSGDIECIRRFIT